MTNGVTVKVRNLDRLNARFLQLVPTAEVELSKATLIGANEIAGLARRLAPKGTDERRELLESIVAKPMDGRPGAVVEMGGPLTRKTTPRGTYNYVAAQELGTAEMPANPSLYPAARTLAKKNKNRMGRALSKAAKSVAAK